MVRAPVPECRRRGWVKDPADAFIMLALEAKGLAPAAAADRHVLGRRLAFVLTGLPPDPEELRDYVQDRATDDVATDRLVERYLASPRFGERWARHWMDVVRYGDTYGYEWDMPAKGAWRYRDYLVRAFNADVGFDQLVREQIAGDLLKNPRLNAIEQINESVIGPMFFQLGEKRHGDSAEFDGIHQEMVHNKIDAFSKAFQGVTVGCARCHDHKLDAVSQRDYYALAGSFMSARWVTHTLDTRDRNAEVLAELREIKVRLRKTIGEEWVKEAAEWPREWLAGSRKSPSIHTAMSKAIQPGRAAGQREDLFYGWVELKKVADQRGNVGAAWERMAASYAQERRARAASNARFVTIADFSKGVPDGWSVDGVGLRDGPNRPGDFTVALEGARAIASILPAGLFTHRLSPRLNGAVRSPYLGRLAMPWLSVQSRGGEFSAERTVVDNAFLTERQTFLARDSPAWTTVAPLPEFKGRNVFYEVATKTSNPNFPPRVGLGGACSEAQVADPRSWFGITRAVVSQSGGVPQDDLRRFDGLFKGRTPQTFDEVAERYATWLRESIKRFTDDDANDDDVIILSELLELDLLPNRSDAAGGRKVGRTGRGVSPGRAEGSGAADGSWHGRPGPRVRLSAEYPRRV